MNTEEQQQKPKWRLNPPCQNYKCPFYAGVRNPDIYNNCIYEYLQENCVDYKNEYQL